MAPQDLFGLPGGGGGAITVTFKKGTAAGDYTTTSATFVRVDATNLAYTVTVPTGQKLLIAASGTLFNTAGNWDVALADGTADNTGILNLVEVSANSNIIPFALSWVLVGDGTVHTVNLQFRTSAGTLLIKNLATFVPTMTFWLGPAN